MIDPYTLESKNRKLDDKLDAIENPIVIEGQFNLDYIPNSEHPTMKFDAIATANNTADSDEIYAMAILRRTYNQWFDSLLKMKFRVETGDLGLSDSFDISSESVQLTIKHPLTFDNI